MSKLTNNLEDFIDERVSGFLESYLANHSKYRESNHKCVKMLDRAKTEEIPEFFKFLTDYDEAAYEAQRYEAYAYYMQGLKDGMVLSSVLEVTAND